jgi:hypothetical protein
MPVPPPVTRMVLPLVFIARLLKGRKEGEGTGPL